MFNQILKNIRHFFSSGKKNAFTTEKTYTNSKNTGGTNVRILYHRDIANDLQAAGAKVDDMQHDWWIN